MIVHVRDVISELYIYIYNKHVLRIYAGCVLLLYMGGKVDKTRATSNNELSSVVKIVKSAKSSLNSKESSQMSSNGNPAYENLPIQYTDFFFQKQKLKISLEKKYFYIFVQNIDCGYTLESPRREAVLTCIHNLFLIKNKKNKYTHVNHSFTKVEFKGMHALNGYVFLMI